MIREGGCLCGAVRFKAEGEPLNVRICHCRICQKAMGSPFFARAQFDQRALTVDGDTERYASSENIDRVFCKRCGTRLFAWRRNGNRLVATSTRKTPAKKKPSAILHGAGFDSLTES